MIAHSKRSLVIGMLFIAAAFAITSHTIAQPSTAEFDIVVEQTDDGFALTCNDGCAWEKLSWEGHEDVKVNYFGMTADEEAERFLFMLSSTDDGFELEGLEGTAWLSLDWTCQDDASTCKARVDESGIWRTR